MRKDSIALWVVRTVVYVGLFAALFYLFMQQATGAYPSDLPAHVTPPADDTYSALRILYTALIGAFGLAGVAAFLALAEIGTIAVTEWLLRGLAPSVKPAVAFVVALACNFAIAIYIPFLHSYFTVGSPGGNCWHNSTYEVMRLLALLAMVFYLKFDGRIPTRSKAASWAGFAVMLTLATSVKPSFAITFGPAVFVLCLVDLKREGRASVKRSLLVGLALIVALLVVLWQMTILFPGDGSGEGGIAFGLAKVWRGRNHYIVASFFQSLAFPLLVALRARKRLLDDRTLLLAMLVTVVAMAEYVFLYETGERTYHGNFGWGLSFALFYLFIVAAAEFVNARGALFGLCGGLSEGMQGSPSSAENRASAESTPKDEGGKPGQTLAAQGAAGSSAARSGPDALDAVTLLAFLLHTGSGVWYFVRIMLGMSYY